MPWALQCLARCTNISRKNIQTISDPINLLRSMWGELHKNHTQLGLKNPDKSYYNSCSLFPTAEWQVSASSVPRSPGKSRECSRNGLEWWILLLQIEGEWSFYHFMENLEIHNYSKYNKFIFIPLVLLWVSDLHILHQDYWMN